MLPQALQQFVSGAIGDQLEFAAVAPHAQCRFQVEFRRRLRKACANFPITLAGVVGVQRQHGLTVIDDRELVNQSLEFSDEVGGNQDRALAGNPFLVRADHRPDRLREAGRPSRTDRFDDRGGM